LSKPYICIMIAKTKKFQLDPNKYIMIATGNLLKEQWWYGFGPLALGSLSFFLPGDAWYITFAILIPLGYLLFWMAQFAGVTRMEQSKMMFEKMSYEIDSRQILMKLNAKMGSALPWDQITKAKKGKDHFLLIASKAQFIYLPFDAFQNQNSISFVESILKRKELI